MHPVGAVEPDFYGGGGKANIMATTDVSLWRAVRKEAFADGTIVDGHAVAGVLYPDFEERQIGRKVKGVMTYTTRAPDLAPTKGKPSDGEDATLDYVNPGGGTSLFDKADVFGGASKGWFSFKIPDGTSIPDSILVKNDGRREERDATHYQLEPLTRMRVDAYKGALDNLARNAIARSVERNS